MTREELLLQVDALLSAHPNVDADRDHLVQVLQVCRMRRLARGELLCEEGQPGAELFFLLEGRVDVLRTDERGRLRTIGHLQAPALLGHMAIITRAWRSATCEALTRCRVAVLDPVAFHALVRATDVRGRSLRRLLLSSLTQQLVQGNARLRQLMTGDIADPAVRPNELGPTVSIHGWTPKRPPIDAPPRDEPLGAIRSSRRRFSEPERSAPSDGQTNPPVDPAAH